MNGVVTLEDVISVIRESHGFGERKAITESSLLENDLGITGDDGCELLEEIRNKFGVSFAGSDGTLREAFCLKHDEFLFHSEGMSLFLMVASFFGFAIEKVKPLSVGELHQVVAKLKESNAYSATAA